MTAARTRSSGKEDKVKQIIIGDIQLGDDEHGKLYMCDRGEGRRCRELGVPYVIKPDDWDEERLVKCVLYVYLSEKFPDIWWPRILGPEACNPYAIQVNVPHRVKAPVVGQRKEVAAEYRDNPGFDTTGLTSPDMEFTVDGEYRMTGGGLDADDKVDWEDEITYDQERLDKYIKGLGFYVDIEQLQALHLLPVFLDDIANAIKKNLYSAAWCDGYNKKLGCNLGSWKGGSQAPNLIVLDVSGSIPSGVAGTMVSLIDTLRSQADADLIITSGRSEFFPANEGLPSPDQLSGLIGGCNERIQFYDILRKHVIGKHWGNVIVFGDQDAPADERLKRMDRLYGGGVEAEHITDQELQSTRIDRIMAFHTYAKKVPGYGLWAVQAAPKAEVVYNTEWTKEMKGR